MPDIQPLRFDDFKILNCTFEIRFPPALVIWDRAGALWKEVMDHWPETAILDAQPAKVVVRLGATTQLASEIAQARISQAAVHKSLSSTIELSRDFFEIVIRHLEIAKLTRIGLRCQYFRESENIPDAVSSLLHTRLVRPPERVFGSDEAPTELECLLRWEKKGLGAVVRLGTQKREYEMAPPPELEGRIKREEIKMLGVHLDVDVYSAAVMEVGQFSAEEWVKQALHMTNRDVDQIFGG